MIKEYKLSSKELWQDIFNDFGDKGGAYKLFCRKNNRIEPIGRLLGTDQKGILYIGKATSYLDRVIGLKKTIDPEKKSSSHICGRRYNKNEKISKTFPFKNLYIILIGHNEPLEKETELLTEYFNTFGEVPPLNANG